MSVVIETTLGDITVDLYLKRRPRACLNFLKLCKIKYYNFNLFHTISRGFIAQTGDPSGSRTGGESIWGVLEGPTKRYFEAETNPKIKHTVTGLISFVGNENGMLASQFFITLGNDSTYLDDKHCVFGEVVEGLDVIEQINEAICDGDDRPYQDIRITHTVVLDDPFPDPSRLEAPSRSPSPSVERLKGGRIAPDEEIDETEGKSAIEINEMIAEREAKARATILEMVGDLPDADMAPPENVLFVCKLNPVTTDDDLEIIFSRFGKIKSCEVIRDKKSGDSLQYAFVEFEEQKACEDAYFKMDNVLIDDRRIHVDFSQSVAKIKWLGKGRGVRNFGEKDNDLGKGKYSKEGNDRGKNNGRKNSSSFVDRGNNKYEDKRRPRESRNYDGRNRHDHRDDDNRRRDHRDDDDNRRHDHRDDDNRRHDHRDDNNRRHDERDYDDRRYDQRDDRNYKSSSSYKRSYDSSDNKKSGRSEVRHGNRTDNDQVVIGKRYYEDKEKLSSDKTKKKNKRRDSSSSEDEKCKKNKKKKKKNKRKDSSSSD